MKWHLKIETFGFHSIEKEFSYIHSFQLAKQLFRNSCTLFTESLASKTVYQRINCTG